MLELDNEQLFSVAEVEDKEIKHSLQLKTGLSEKKGTECNLCRFFIFYYKTVTQIFSKWASWLVFLCRSSFRLLPRLPSIFLFYKSKNGEQ